MRHLPIRARRLLLGGFLVYLFGILGFQGASHGHVSVPGDPHSLSQTQGQGFPQTPLQTPLQPGRHSQPDPHPHSQSECQLCQITAHAYLAPQPLVCHESPAAPVRLVEAVRAPVLSERFRPFSSRAPPSV